MPSQTLGTYFMYGVMRMYKLRDHLSDDEIKKLKAKKKKDKLSMRDVMELMGVRRDTYKRVRGAIRRK